MELHRGRLIDHLHFKVRDIEAAQRFYQVVADVFGVPLVAGSGHFYIDELWVDIGEPHAHAHLAFQAQDRATVDRFYAAALAAGGTDNGGPGERSYHPGYYAAFVYDPDGNNIEAVHHGPYHRSAPSVVLTI